MAAVRQCWLPAAGRSPAAAKLGGFVQLNATDLRRFHHVAMCRCRCCCWSGSHSDENDACALLDYTHL